MSTILPAAPLWPFIQNSGRTLIIGDRGAFKSSVAYAIAQAVASGSPFSGLDTTKRVVMWHSFDSLDDRDIAHYVVTNLGSPISMPTEIFQITCDADLTIGSNALQAVAIIAAEQPRGCLVVLDDLENVAGASVADDVFLAAVMGAIMCHTRSSVSLLATLTATPNDLKSKSLFENS
jgi:hypothetical protein